jgi:ABC-2 type transport system ATP-binding protein
MDARVSLRRFSVSYPSFTLAPLTLDFRAGERVAFVGPNGSGKSTTLRALAGRLSGYSGDILLDGDDLRGLLPFARRRIGLLPETLAGYGWMTVREHLALIRGFHPGWDDAYAARLLARLRVPLDELMGRLSKGTRMKVSFVAAEAYRPPLLLLDEPTSGLDPEVRRELVDAVLAATGERTDRVVLFSTHLLEDVGMLAERVVLLVKGALQLDAPVSELRESHPGATLPEILYAVLARANG